MPVYERLIPDPRDELMGNEWDVMEEHPMGHPSGVGFEAGAGDDDIERAILESMKQHNNNYGGGSNDIEDELLARAIEESK